MREFSFEPIAPALAFFAADFDVLGADLTRAILTPRVFTYFVTKRLLSLFRPVINQ
jgi:hypothetical protein